MGVYISGLQMPKNDGDVLSIDIYPDGEVRLQYNYNLGAIATAIPVPDHGDLVDMNYIREHWPNVQYFGAPVIIPADNEQT